MPGTVLGTGEKATKTDMGPPVGQYLRQKQHFQKAEEGERMKHSGIPKNKKRLLKQDTECQWKSHLVTKSHLGGIKGGRNGIRTLF